MPRIKKESEIKKEPKESKMASKSSKSGKIRKQRKLLSSDSESSADNLPLKHKKKSKSVKGDLGHQNGRKKASVTLKRLNPPPNSTTARISTRKVSKRNICF